MLHCPARFSSIFLPKIELWGKHCKHVKCSWMIGLQFLYREFSLNPDRSYRKMALKMACQTVSGKIRNLLIFISSFRQIFVLRLNLFKNESCSFMLGIHFSYRKFLQIPNRFGEKLL